MSEYKELKSKQVLKDKLVMPENIKLLVVVYVA